jgi:hypothetical protein
MHRNAPVPAIVSTTSAIETDRAKNPGTKPVSDVTQGWPNGCGTFGKATRKNVQAEQFHSFSIVSGGGIGKITASLNG